HLSASNQLYGTRRSGAGGFARSGFERTYSAGSDGSVGSTPKTDFMTRRGQSMLVLGMMSGTSADGIDVGLARISGRPPRLSIKLEGHHHVPFSSSLRKTILRVANAEPKETAEISQLNFALGEEFALAATAACKVWRVPLQRISLIGSHG